MLQTTTITQTRAACASAGSIALVPTMGALHEGHLSLVRKARQLAPFVAVSIFVNPTQFGQSEDLSRYPRPLLKDLELCRRHGVDLVFTPEPGEIYPPDETPIRLIVPSLDDILEGQWRPGHFAGVCQVVAKLLNIFNPHFACFGGKDFQQLMVVTAMARSLCMPTLIVPCPTVREPDGLAMSSRNVFLSPAMRGRALGLHAALTEARAMAGAGSASPWKIETRMLQILKEHNCDVQYAVVRDSQTLGPITRIGNGPGACGRPVALIAAMVDEVRLIDNMILTSDQ